MGPIFPTQLFSSLTRNIDERHPREHSRHIVGFDYGIDHPAAGVWIAWDYQTDVIYVIDSFRMRHGSARQHVDRIHAMTKGLRMRVAYGHDLNKRESNGEAMAKQYRDAGGNFLDTHAVNPGTKDISIWPGLNEIRDRMIAGTLIINACNTELLDELRNIHRGEDGKVVKLNDDLCSALRYALMMKSRGLPRAQYDGIGYGNLPDAYQQRADMTDPRQRFAKGTDNYPGGSGWDIFTGTKFGT